MMIMIRVQELNLPRPKVRDLSIDFAETLLCNCDGRKWRNIIDMAGDTSITLFSMSCHNLNEYLPCIVKL